MPILLTPIVHKSLLHGYTWAVTDEQLLAELIARVALGQARHVNKILLNIGTALPVPVDDAWAAAAKMLTVPVGTEPWHRDGWMFQVMSWLSAHKAGSKSLINTPQMIFAQKGFDGIQLDFDPVGAISAVVIFEDKATDNPRKTIRDEVWPEFEEYESGGDANVLVAEVTGLLEKRQGIDVDDVVRRVIWKDARHFRVSITVGKLHATNAGRGRLFKDYDTKVQGNVKRRRGETFYVDDLRSWMDSIASKVLAHIAALKAAHV
ncbi:conserved hypothetical protein [Leptothrix cholodnii SP-6]|uniref:Uncharacterized protein n=1 Tax=Leptothrix cholodnii (strain ATCC 51168 / LMG 8142 / SP-6) TaxID=395495 RepID=B1Y167_LEPCP|nr:hypothetical protein [Leptothrix cholodnii]ACB33044.1 conserved hypothetical protein [Leptothrix cholodnii SP-6]